MTLFIEMMKHQNMIAIKYLRVVELIWDYFLTFGEK